MDDAGTLVRVMRTTQAVGTHYDTFLASYLGAYLHDTCNVVVWCSH